MCRYVYIYTHKKLAKAYTWAGAAREPETASTAAPAVALAAVSSLVLSFSSNAMILSTTTCA